MTKILLTGASGFAGRHFVDEVLKNTDLEIVSLERRPSPGRKRVRVIGWDFVKFDTVYVSDCDPRYFIHFAASVHALGSLTDPRKFVRANTLGTLNVLELARELNPELFVYISTAEVLGGKEKGYSAEDDPLRPSNPYSASKAAGELLTQTYQRCFGLPTIVVRSMNLYDLDTQTDESKFVPMVKKAVLAGEIVKIHVRNKQPGMRQWMLGTDFAKELLALLPQAEPGKTYHLVGEELSNLDMAKRVADHLKMPLKYELVDIPKTHEHRYAMSSRENAS